MVALLAPTCFRSILLQDSLTMSERIHINLQHAISSVIEPGWSRMEQKFRPLVQTSPNHIEIQVLCALALRITRLAIAGDLLARKGLDEEGHALQRPALEAIINLSYIFYSGPRVTAKSGKSEKDTLGLCEQFCAYANVAYVRVIRRDPNRIREVFQKHRGLSDAECDQLIAENIRLAIEASATHGCAERRWHKSDLRSMVNVVLSDPPPFIDSEILRTIVFDLDSSNSSVHADALSMRTQYSDHGTDLLKLVYKEQAMRGDIVAALALSSWRAIGWYFGELDWVVKMINRELGNEFRKRLNAQARLLSGFIVTGKSSHEFPWMPLKSFVLR